MTSDGEVLIAAGALIMGLIVNIVGAFIYISKTTNDLRREVSMTTDAVRRELVKDIDQVRNESTLRLEKAMEASSKAKHDLANLMSTTSNRLERDLQQLSRDSVRITEHKELESRLTMSLNRLGEKVDKVSDAVLSLAGLEKQLEKVSAKLETLCQHPGSRIA